MLHDELYKFINVQTLLFKLVWQLLLPFLRQFLFATMHHHWKQFVNDVSVLLFINLTKMRYPVI